MKDDYVPNEKYRNMFGVERNGYGMERVDLYLAQLEVAFKKIREDNRSLKRELSGQPAVHTQPMGLVQPEHDAAMHAAVQQQEAYIAQLQAQLGQEQEQSHHMQAQMAEMQEQNRLLLAKLGELSANQASAQPAAESLIAQINALRAEADELRQQLRRQAASTPASTLYQASAQAGILGEEQHSLIGKVLVEARQQAEETLRAAQQEADQLTRKTRQRVDELRAERDRVYSQLQGISFALRNVLRESGESEYKRGEEFAAS